MWFVRALGGTGGRLAREGKKTEAAGGRALTLIPGPPRPSAVLRSATQFRRSRALGAAVQLVDAGIAAPTRGCAAQSAHGWAGAPYR